MAFPKGGTVAHTPFICFACGKQALRGNIAVIGAGRATGTMVKICRDAKCEHAIHAGKSKFLKRNLRKSDIDRANRNLMASKARLSGQ